MTNVNQPETNGKPTDVPLDDTRDKLWEDCDDLIRRIQERIFSGRDKTALRYQFAELLDRQAAITKRECERLIIEQQVGLAERDRRIVELAEACDKAKAERDEFQVKLENFEGDCYCGATVVEWHEMACKLQGKVDELTAERDCYKRYNGHYRELVGKWQKLYEGIDETHMRLPVDADGVPCRIGDMMDWDGGRHDVMAVSDNCVWFDTDPYELLLTCYESSGCRHVQTDTVESLLQELADEVWEASCESHTTWSDSGLDGIAERYAERIRKACQ